MKSYLLLPGGKESEEENSEEKGIDQLRSCSKEGMAGCTNVF